MMKKNLIITTLIFLCIIPAAAQTKQQELKREVTLYNPYKPSLPEVKKRSFLPEMNDTSKIRHEVIYDIKSSPFTPAYTISPIKSASLLPDPLTKLYKSYINIGVGNYVTPLAEVSITNERSKKGAIGFYGRHFSTNGTIKLQNDKRVFAGLMDNDASLFGKKFFRKSFLEGSVDFSQKIRYAYGYDTSITDYKAVKKDIRIGYNNLGAKASYSSLNLDSTSFSYDFDVYYDFFYNAKYRYQHSAGFSGEMAKLYKGFYMGAGIGYDHYRLSDLVYSRPKYIASISPFLKRNSDLYSVKLGFQAVIERNMTQSVKLHLYPDIRFGFSIVPQYISLFAGLNGKLEKNDPLKVIEDNPFLVPDGSLFRVPNTDHSLIISGGVQGNTGIGGNYLVSASYSVINDMLFYSNITFPDSLFTPEMGNHFIPLPDKAELINLHGEMTGAINDKISFNAMANYYKYTLTTNDYAWNKPAWDSRLGLKYNLRNKIIAGVDLTALGKRKVVVNKGTSSISDLTSVDIQMPAHFNLNIAAEYRYTKILSFWAKINNISFNRYYDWAYYPTKNFLFMVGFTYSL